MSFGSLIAGVHSFHSKRALRRLHLGSLMLLLFLTCTALVVPAVAVGFFAPGNDGFLIASALLGGSVLSGILFLIISPGATCPLCHATLLGGRGFSRNRKAPRLFGSYRLATAVSALFRGRFRCSACGEPSRCQVRTR